MTPKGIPTTEDRFCAFCFAPISEGDVTLVRGRRYCTTRHADADQRKHDAVAAIDEFTTPQPPPCEQLELGGGDG